ncbi:nucleolar protein 8 isoform X2 [Loxodonta africana]|uniref:nucleolar protein 8 isoform X2 n=1 Tax=Loxodonta africana TaxID=9785 RepID=UPI0030D10D0F
MKANREMKRLYVGGLSQAISQADLQNQFSRFGEVSDVEIITRKDEQGNPQKIFAYINIRVAEADLKKCMSVLNKTKWKGGTLQIEQAKESFLHRLAQEREEAKVKKENSRPGNTDLLKKMRAVDLHVKAVPGTEVPGHKNWVVSKFGRVLPVLHLKNQHKRKWGNIIKYDPSKYCHNLKKIGEDSINAIPVTSLTWKLEGGNDPMSKKRRGEFSDFHSPPKKKIKVQCGEGAAGPLAVRPRHSSVVDSPLLIQQQAAQNTPRDSISLCKSPCVPNSYHQKPKNVPFQTCGLETARNKNSMSDDDIDSEEELRAVIAREESLQRATQSSVKEPENDPFVVVRDDFKSDVHKLYLLPSLGIKNKVSCQVNNDNVIGNDCAYDSEDTDEIIAMKKNVGKVQSSTEFLNREKSVCEKASLKDRKGCEFSEDSVKIQKRKKKAELAVSSGVRFLNCKSPSGSSDSEDAASVSESAESEGDEEYNALMKNCLRVDLTLADLQQLGCSDAEAPRESTASDSQETTTSCQFVRASKGRKGPDNPRRGKRCIHPEDIVASLLEGEKNTCSKQKPKENKFQAFKGIGSLYGKESRKNSLKEGVASNNINKDQDSLKLEDPSSISMEKRPSYADGSSRELTPCQHTKKANSPNHTEPQNRQTTFESQDPKVVSASNSEKESRSTTSSLLPLTGKKSLSLGAKIHKIDFDKDGRHSNPKIEDGSEEERADSCSLTSEKPPKVSSGKDRPSSVFSKKAQDSRSDFPHPVSNPSEDRHAQDNQKRLAALDARQKAKEIQKKLVHNALANLDDHSEIRPTHIVFGSDNESETKETDVQEQSNPRQELGKESIYKASGKLFDSSNEEESDSEDDSNRFKIKPQFEGRAGQKLMDLQSRFGTDDRFRMDSRFLESDSEEEQEEVNEEKTAEEEVLAAEKKKALDVVQSVLHINLNNSTSKGSVTVKKFKDIIHYDPTRHDHATFERKRDDEPKESKSKRKKKRAECEKLPEVSKEMYYNIAADLKERLQTTKDSSEKKENIPWNADCDGDKTEIHDPTPLKNGIEEPAGFTFSFFDSDAKDVKEETYRVGTVKPGKIAWQENPRSQDTSSEEEDTTEVVDHRKPSPGEVSLPEKENNRFFFFCKDDERLHGSGLFWKGAGSDTSRNCWEARTNNLRMDCRKKHKDAKRKVKPK